MFQTSILLKKFILKDLSLVLLGIAMTGIPIFVSESLQLFEKYIKQKVYHAMDERRI